jgi:hypothetical protein
MGNESIGGDSHASNEENSLEDILHDITVLS